MAQPYYIATVTLTDAWMPEEFGLLCEYAGSKGKCRHAISYEESFEFVGLGNGKREVWCMDHQSERDGQQAREEGVHD